MSKNIGSWNTSLFFVDVESGYKTWTMDTKRVFNGANPNVLMRLTNKKKGPNLKLSMFLDHNLHKLHVSEHFSQRFKVLNQSIIWKQSFATQHFWIFGKIAYFWKLMRQALGCHGSSRYVMIGSTVWMVGSVCWSLLSNNSVRSAVNLVIRYAQR